MLTHRFDLMLRVLVEQPAEGIWRVQLLEVSQFVIVSDWMRGVELLHNLVEQWCRDGAQIPFCEPSAGLLQAYGDAVADEDCAMGCGVCYKGALARIVHVMASREEVAA